MLITATFLGCAACVMAYQIWRKPRRAAVSGPAARPTVGLHGALVEPRK